MIDRDSLCILLADDDPDDRLLARRSLKKSRLANRIESVEDGEQLMDYLHRIGRYEDPMISPRPGLILLVLNMPRKDGREALQEIKSDPSLRRIPVVVLTTSEAEEDILRAYELRVTDFVTEPGTLEGLANAIHEVGAIRCEKRKH